MKLTLTVGGAAAWDRGRSSGVRLKRGPWAASGWTVGNWDRGRRSAFGWTVGDVWLDRRGMERVEPSAFGWTVGGVLLFVEPSAFGVRKGTVGARLREREGKRVRLRERESATERGRERESAARLRERESG